MIAEIVQGFLEAAIVQAIRNGKAPGWQEVRVGDPLAIFYGRVIPPGGALFIPWNGSVPLA